ncbi:hypothetical protein ACKFKG_07310 [Phormidesmis sp. 146-35]
MNTRSNSCDRTSKSDRTTQCDRTAKLNRSHFNPTIDRGAVGRSGS